MKTLGQIAYEAYNVAMRYVEEDILEWNDGISEDIKEAWEEAAKAVIDAQWGMKVEFTKGETWHWEGIDYIRGNE